MEPSQVVDVDVSNEKKPGTGASNKRRKELAAAKLERQAARRAERAERHKRRMRIGWGIAALVGVLAVAALVFWPDSGGDDVAEHVAAARAAGWDAEVFTGAARLAGQLAKRGLNLGL